MMYGVECTGISDTSLKKTIGLAAAAISPPAMGKSARMTLHGSAPLCTTADPTYVAHVAPIKTWATAVWDGWASMSDMATAHRNAAARIRRAKTSAWGLVHGPATALVATCERLGWHSADGRTFTDDTGVTHDVALDPPQAIADAAARSCKRWCLKQVIGELPTAAPSAQPPASAPGHSGPPQRVICDVSDALRPLYRGGKKLAETHPQWHPKHRPGLTSAIAGGQWTQARKAKLPNWQHGNLCQLCTSDVGTLAHRRCCPATVTKIDWPPEPDEVARFDATLTPARKRLLADRAVLVVDVPIPPPQVDSHRWHWHVAPPDICDDTLRWYIDGSRRHPTSHELATTGCGVAVVDNEGKLVGLASATPPPWVKSSSAAETWALYLTLAEVTVIPTIVTDCLGLLNTAAAGFAVAKGSSSANARIWTLIDEVTSGLMAPLRDALVWTPAHTSIDQCLHRRRSDLRHVSSVDWRANQLADVLAKSAAMDDPGRRAAAKHIRDAKSSLLHHAMQVGLATYQANNHEVSRTNPDGSQTMVSLRDSTPLPPGSRRTDKLPAGIKRKSSTLAVQDCVVHATAGSNTCNPRAAARSSCRRARTAAAKRAEQLLLADAIHCTAARLVAPAGEAAASVRMAALRERIRARALVQA